MMRNINLIKNKKDYIMFAKNNVFKRGVFFLLTIFLLMPGYASAEEGIVEKTLVIYYSRTGKTKLISETYQSIVVASPVWNWKISTPIHTFFDANKFDGKKVVLITNANIHIMKYEQYSDDASFVKRFLKDYIRGKKKTARSVFMAGSGEYVGHYHIETKERTDEEIVEDTLKFADDIKQTISPDGIDVAKRIEQLQDRKI